ELTGREEQPVLELPDPSQRAHELAGVGEGPARLLDVQREHRDPDHAGSRSSAAASSSRNRSGECSRATYSRPRRRISASRPGSARRPRTVSASSSAENPASTTPPPDSSTSDSGPPEGVVTTGTPAASASATTIPNASWYEGRTSKDARRSCSATDGTTPVASARSGSGPAGREPI